MAIEIRAGSTLSPAPAPPTASAGASLAALLPRRERRVPVAQRVFFTERLALLLESGVALHGALETLAGQLDDPAARAAVADLLAQVLEGKPFGVALGAHPEMFPRTYVNLVGAAEGGGFLPQVLDQLKEMDESSQRLRRELVSAVAYPAFLVAFSFATVVFVLVSVFPKFKEMFSAIHDQLPLTTRALMVVSDLLVHWWPGLLAGSVVLGAAAVGWVQRANGQAVLDRLLLGLPLVRGLTMQVYLLHTMRVMGMSLAHGVSVMNALEGCRDLIRNTRYRAFMAEVEEKVHAGQGLAAGFERPELVPPLVRQLLATGEQSGNLAKVMLRVADFYQREITRRVSTLARMAEPFMLLVMGALVGLIVSSLILPIFKLARAVH